MNMKILHLNTTVNISSAPYKLHKAMLDCGMDSRLLVMRADGITDVDILDISVTYKIKRRIGAYKRNRIKKNLNLKEYMPIDILPIGIDISKHKLVKEADIICIHWINSDFLSCKEIKKLIDTGKTVYQFCHDNYTFTGGCHVRMGCQGYKEGCSKCQQISGSRAEEIIDRAIKDKDVCYNAENITFVSPSSWMDSNVTSSSIYHGQKHLIIPNVIDTDIYKPVSIEDRIRIRSKYGIDKDSKVILCPIKADERVPYNGAEYLWEVLKSVSERDDVRVVTFGIEKIEDNHGINLVNVGFVSDRDELIGLYSMADVMLITSLEDSFNMAAAECIASGTEVVAFNNGGIVDIIRHKENGYMAELYDAKGLIDGINYILSSTEEADDKEDRLIKSIKDRFSREKVIEIFRARLVTGKGLAENEK